MKGDYSLRIHQMEAIFQIGKNIGRDGLFFLRESGWTLAYFEWRAAAPGPLRLPCARPKKVGGTKKDLNS